jgi:ABC-type taurine transport system ATPase subunit
LAIDPEFAMADGQIPGEYIGSIDATDVAWAQRWLVDLANEAGTSPKVLIVHQFKESMITNKDQIVRSRGSAGD